MWDALEMFIGVLVPVVGILVLSYWCSRYLGKRWGGRTSGNYLKIIDRIQVGADRYLLLVKLQEHTYLIGVSDKGVQLLTEPEGTFEIPEEEKGTIGFQEILKNCGAFSKGGKHD